MKRVMQYVLKYKIFILISATAMITAIVMDMLQPYLSKIIVDEVIRKKNIQLLMPVLFVFAMITLLKAVLGYIKEYFFDYMASKVSEDLKKDLFNKIQSLSFSYFDKTNTGELMSRIGEDIDQVWEATGFGVALLIENILSFAVASIILFTLNAKLALVCLIPMPIIAYLAWRLERRNNEIYGKISDHGVVINTAAQENIAGVRLVKAFAREKYEVLKFLKLNQTNYQLNIEQSKAWSIYFPLIEFLSNLSMIFVVIFGGIFVIKQQMTLGTLVAFTGYIWSLVWPMRLLGWLMNVYAQSQASAQRIFEIMDTAASVTEPENPVRKEKIAGSIVFENVSFRYDSQQVLNNICLEVKPGSTVAIMGPTGTGKSSLIHLIGRFYDVTEGRVLVDGVDVRELSLQHLRRQMAVVSQDMFLFSDTISNNLRYGKENASQKEIEKACQDACAHEFIMKLSDGYETVIGERGVGLSGGQKQRISIARALIRNAAILILDDSTSALDLETEHRLLKNLFNREYEPTTFIIAHRISAVKNADQILFIEDGYIVERGTHEQLLALEGRYYEVYCEQFKEFEELDGQVG